jgi:hypothetical protein
MGTSNAASCEVFMSTLLNKYHRGAPKLKITWGAALDSPDCTTFLELCGKSDIKDMTSASCFHFMHFI